MLGHVQDTYIWYEAAGDQYVGCMLLCLPMNLYKFALVGPHFVIVEAADDDSAVLVKSNIHECISSCFLSSFPTNSTAVLMHGLPAVCLSLTLWIASCLHSITFILVFFSRVISVH